MALFGKKKKNEEVTPAEEVKTDVKADNSSTLDLIKEAMEEAKEERKTQTAEETASVPKSAYAPSGMPTAEEIRKAQEVLARAQAGNAGANAPINTANLKAVVANFVANKSQENIKLVMDCLQKPQTLVCVPAQIITSPENQEKMKQGGEMKLEGPVHINPVILTDNNGKKVFPVFSGEDTIPDDLKKKTPKVNMPFVHCVNIMKNIKDVDTFALDPYTANIRINVNIQENAAEKN